MALNYKPGEAIKVLHEGTDTEAIIDIAKRYPLLSVNAFTFEGLVKIVDAIPSHISARQLNRSLAGDVEESEQEPAEDQKKTDKPAEKSKKEKENADDEWGEDSEKPKSFAAMSTDELKAALKERKLIPEKGAKISAVIKMIEDFDKKVVKEKEKKDKKDKVEKPADDEWDI